MKWIWILVIGLITTSFAGPDSLKIQALSKKLDSLSMVLHDEKLSAAYAKETMVAYKASEDSLKDMFQSFLIGTISILGIASVGLGVWVYTRTEGERKAVAIQVRDLVKPGFDTRMEELNILISGVEGRLAIHTQTYFQYAGVTENAIAATKGKLDSYVKATDKKLDELDEIKQIAKRVQVLEIKDTAKEIGDNRRKIYSHIQKGELDLALEETLSVLYSIDGNNPFAAFDFMYPVFAAFLLDIVAKATSIIPKTKDRLLETELLEDDDYKTMRGIVENLPVSTLSQVQQLTNPDPGRI